MEIDKLNIQITSNSDEAVSGLDRLTEALKRISSPMEQSGNSANKASKGYSTLAASMQSLNKKANFAVLIYGFSRLQKLLSGFVNSSAKYIEDLNLFTVAMGEFADKTYQYAQQVERVMGIDSSSFMRNIGTFQKMLTGYGVEAQNAYVMSTNLTQLAYDPSQTCQTHRSVDKMNINERQ